MAKQIETRVQLKNVHLCCQACVDGVNAALKGLKRFKSQGDMKHGIVTFSRNTCFLEPVALFRTRLATHGGHLSAVILAGSAKT